MDDTSLHDWLVSIGTGTRQPGMMHRMIEVVRRHLGMEVAYISEFVGNNSVFREVDAPGLEHMIKVGDSISLDDVYCRHILAGRIPEFMPDTSAEPNAMALPITTALPIGKHMSVPIRLRDGSAYGMFCCLGPHPDPSLRQRDLQMMKAFAELAAFEIEQALALRRSFETKRDRVRTVIDDGQISIVYQPIWNVATGRPLGVECLSRISATPSRPPNEWFADAAETGLGLELEITAIRLALAALPAFPPEVYLTVNASPATLLSPELNAILAGHPSRRIVVELTEHEMVENYEEIIGALQEFRTRGLRLAVDDAGTGYSSLQHILHLRPDLIKLDMNLTRNIDLDPSRRALAAALIRFARETNSRIIAEGVETEAELQTLRQLGVEKVQGYLLGRPMPLAAALELFEHPRAPA
ncbi:sensor domain-containing phosphodiesterase [Ancylobacter radicis]|uniref:EAL domain-containing protein n=1 Tax=Ancylobacter radicis TaxID=2836179 RepID=A0ABS5R9K1_9HYPH|nr:EAL domain-containing protein [Ancylobacter radicis]MBS9478358.1 EAL domain-containing protein [Ancylobacter radicis]